MTYIEEHWEDIDLSVANCRKTKVLNGRKKVKNYKPKYNYIEAITVNDETFRVIGLFRWDTFLKRFGECPIESVHDYDDTKSTSIVVRVK